MTLIKLRDSAEEEVGKDIEEEIPDGEALGTGIHLDLCIEQHAPSAAMSVKFRFGQAVTDRYTAATALKKEATRMAIYGNQIEETPVDQVIVLEILVVN